MSNHEFPDFDYDLPVIPGMTDASWHNDVMPRLATKDDRLTLWCDYADKAKREFDAGNQYCLVLGEYGLPGDEQTTLYDGDDLAECLKVLWAAARYDIAESQDREGNNTYEVSVYIPYGESDHADLVTDELFYDRAKAEAWLTATYPEVWAA